MNDANATAVDGLSIGARAHCIRSLLGNPLNKRPSFSTSLARFRGGGRFFAPPSPPEREIKSDLGVWERGGKIPVVTLVNKVTVVTLFFPINYRNARTEPQLIFF